MLSYIIKRILVMIPTLLGIAFVTFLIINMAPGDPVAAQLGGGDERSEGGGGGRDRQADAIKAKKKLLGILAEDHNVIAWDLEAASRVVLPQLAEGELFRPEELEIKRRLGPLKAWPRSLRLAPDGQTLYVGGDDKLIYAVKTTDGEVVRTFEGHDASIWSMAVSGDSALLVSADSDGYLRLWDARSGKVVATPESLGKSVRDVLFLPDGKRFLTACDDGKIRMHDASSGAVTQTFEGHIGGVYALAMAADGSRFWSAGYDRKVREWNPTTGQVTLVLAEIGAPVNDLALSPDGRTLAAASDDRILHLYPTTPGPDGAVHPIELRGHYKEVTAVAFSGDGKRLYSGARDETVRTWDLERKLQATQSKEATGRVHGLVVSPDGAQLWSASESWAKVAVYKRFLRWMGRIATLDFDRSFVDDQKVIDKIARALPVTLGLNVLALFIIYAVSIPIGILAAVKRGSTFDHVSSLVLFVLYSIPNFWLATLLIMSFSSKQNLDILPSVGLEPPNAIDLSYFQWLGSVSLHLVLPVIVLVYSGFASLSRYARTSMLETIGQDYIRTARAKGLPERIVVLKHAFRNSLITIVTLVANLLPAMIGGSVIVEYIFSINGMGKLGFDAILARDYPVIMAITTFSAFLTLLGILISDLLYSVVDPRITHS